MPISTHISQSLRQTGDVTVFCRRAVIIRKQTIIGSVSYRNGYWVYRIESYHDFATVVLADIACITAGSAAVYRSHYIADQRTFAPVTCCARARHLIHNTGEGLEGREEGD